MRPLPTHILERETRFTVFLLETAVGKVLRLIRFNVRVLRLRVGLLHLIGDLKKFRALDLTQPRPNTGSVISIF